MRCQVCSSDKTDLFLDLGDQPACIFLSPDQFKSEKKFRLDVYYCHKCNLVQLGHLVDPAFMFGKDYHHIAALSQSFKDHLNAMAEKLSARFKLGKKDLIVDLGSNDGALLEAFAPRTRVLGVDPSDVAEIAIKKGLETLREFFDEKLAAKMAKKYGQAKLITSLNTFAHVGKLDSFVRGVKDLLTDDGVFVSESHYVMDLIKELQYDFIYHEHSRYYSLKHLVYLFKQFGMEVFDVERIPTHSGSIRVFAAKAGAYKVEKSVKELLAAEDAFGLSDLKTYQEFGRKVQEHRKAFPAMLKKLKSQGKTIVGVTFPARAVTLLNYCGIGPDLLSYISERSHLKIGRYSPGTHIVVKDEAEFFGKQPDFGLLLSWHIRKEILPKFQSRGFKGKFIIPLPEPTVVDMEPVAGKA